LKVTAVSALGKAFSKSDVYPRVRRRSTTISGVMPISTCACSGPFACSLRVAARPSQNCDSKELRLQEGSVVDRGAVASALPIAHALRDLSVVHAGRPDDVTGVARDVAGAGEFGLKVELVPQADSHLGHRPVA